MNDVRSLRDHIRKNILKQSVFGMLGMIAILAIVTYFLGRYKAASDLEETARASAKAFRSRILDGDIKTTESQLREVLKLRDSEDVLVLNQNRGQIYKDSRERELRLSCQLVGIACVPGYFQKAEILQPIFFDQEEKILFGYLYLSRAIQIDWIFLALVSAVLALGFSAVFFGIGQITKSSLRILVDGIESWATRLSKDPKDLDSFSMTPYSELLPLKTAIRNLNTRIEEYETSAAEKAKLLLLRGIAHDILSPVAQAQLFLAALKKKAESYPDLEAFIAEAEDSVSKVSAIASQVKILRSLPATTDRTDIIKATETEVQTLRRDKEIFVKNIDLRFDCNGIQKAEAQLSEAELSRILQNLIHNSAQASVNNSKIEVDVIADKKSVTISVRDEGHGIANEIKSKIFQPDFTSKPGIGTGLGLSVVKSIVDRRGGTIAVRSSTLGTAVDIVMPLFADGGNAYVL